MSREVRKKMEAANEEWVEEQCKNVERECQETARRPTTSARLSQRPNSISQQSSNRAVETF